MVLCNKSSKTRVKTLIQFIHMFFKILYFLRTQPRQMNPLAKAGKFIAFAFYCAVVSQLHGQPAAVLDQKFWMTDGPVNAMIVTNGTIYIGGDFSYVGPRTGPVALFDQASGALLASAPRINNAVKAVVSDGSGGWFIGGNFTRIGTVGITNIAHLNPDLTLDTGWNARLVGSAVNALALDNGRLYIGGTFTKINNVTLTGGLAGVNPTSPIVNWNPSLSGTVNAMQVVGGLVYVGGNFGSVGNSNYQNVAAISTTTALANTFNPSTVDQQVLALFVTTTNVYVGGQFTTIGTKAKNRLAALDTNGVANAWNPNPNGIVRALFVTSSNAYVGGDFSTISVASRRCFAAIGLTGSGTAQPLDLQLQPFSTTILVRSILLKGNSLYVGGQFTNALTVRNPVLVGVDISASGLTNLAPLSTDFNGVAGTAFGANAMGSANGKVLVVGEFQSIGGVARQRAAALSIATGAALPWAPTFDAPVLCMAYGTNRIYVGGSFTNYNSTNLVPKVGLGLGAVDPVNGNPVPFNFLGTNGFSPVSINALAVSSSALYAGGLFTVVGNQPRKNLAALDPSTGNPISGFNAILAGGFSFGVTALVLAGTNLYAGGDFTTVSNLAIPRLTALSPVNGAPDASWLSTANGNSPNGQAVTVLTTSTDTLYVGGSFTSIAGLTLNHFAAFSLADKSLVPLDASLASSDTLTGIGATTTAIYVGGTFTAMDGDFRQNLGEMSPVDGSLYAWNPSPDIGPSEIALTDNYAFLGGTFRTFGQSPTNQPNGFFAAFSRAPQILIKKSTPGNVQIDLTTGDRTDAVLQGTTNLASPVWSDIQAYGPGSPVSQVVPTTSPQQFFRVITH